MLKLKFQLHKCHINLDYVHKSTNNSKNIHANMDDFIFNNAIKYNNPCNKEFLCFSYANVQHYFLSIWNIKFRGKDYDFFLDTKDLRLKNLLK